MESGDPTPLFAWQRNCPASPADALEMARVPFEWTAMLDELEEEEEASKSSGCGEKKAMTID